MDRMPPKFHRLCSSNVPLTFACPHQVCNMHMGLLHSRLPKDIHRVQRIILRILHHQCSLR